MKSSVVPLIAALLTLAGPAEARGGEPRILARGVRAFRQAHEKEILREFLSFLSIPNVSTDRNDIGKNADWIVRQFEARGAATRLLTVPGSPPAVLAVLPVAGARRTVTFYAHYDGQPADRREWSSDPWKPVIRRRAGKSPEDEVAIESLRGAADPEWRIYARSAGDDKAAIVGFLSALDALRHGGIAPSVNLKFLLEGEEEAGSPHLSQLLQTYAAELRTDAWILCDGPVHQSRRPLVYFGARGTTDLELTVYGPNHGLHSGHYGNWAPNPISELAALLDSLRDTEGRILVPGFLDDVRPLSEGERRALSDVPRVDEDLEKEFDLGRTEGGGAPLVELIQNPAINFRGISSGHVGAEASNTINPEASASIDFRLVPDQTPEHVRDAIEEHIRRRGFFIVRDAPDAETRVSHPKIVRLKWSLLYPAARTPMDDPVGRRVVEVLEEAAGKPLVKMPMLGGSIPMYLFQGKNHLPVIGVPIANHDDNQHAADENLRVQNLWDGIEAYAALFSGL